MKLVWVMRLPGKLYLVNSIDRHSMNREEQLSIGD